MNWGYKILAVYVVFIAGILFLVFKSSSQKMDLVTTDYYAKELKYQQTIDKTNRYNELSKPVGCEVNDHNTLLLHFPKEFAGKKLTGEAIMYCPSDEANDGRHNFTAQDTLVSIQLPVADKGQYELHLTWQVDGIDYYLEQKLFL